MSTATSMHSLPIDLRVEIRKLAAYIRSDSHIACYLGCTTALVRYERSRMPKTKPHVRATPAASPREEVCDARPNRFISQGEQGSTDLLDGYIRWARKHKPGSNLAGLPLSAEATSTEPRGNWAATQPRAAQVARGSTEVDA